MGKQFLKMLLACMLFFTAGASLADDSKVVPIGHWQGHITYRDANLPFRLNVREEKGEVAALLDLPSLVYVGQIIPIEQGSQDTYILEFPFGLGKFKWTPGDTIVSESGFQVMLEAGAPPPYRKIDISFGAFAPEISGTVYLPEGDGPFPAVLMVAGSGRANRSQWSYASWADYYARLGYAAFIYDRRPEMAKLPSGELMDFHAHARDLATAISTLKVMPEIDPSKIGLAAHSRGIWIAQALADTVPDLAFMIFISPGISTPGEQEVSSILTGMAQDGVSAADMAAARTYLRLYFYVAETGQGWDLLAEAMDGAQNTRWFQYVDQPRTLEDLRWWQAHMNFSTRQYLQKTTTPVLALWGGGDFITPWADYQGRLHHDLELAGNKNFTSVVYARADHRVELDPGIDSDGNWHWFGMAPGVLSEIRDWLAQALAKK